MQAQDRSWSGSPGSTPGSRDATGPSPEGTLPAAGSVAALITHATRRDPYFVGKPNPMMFRSALNRIGAHSENTGMIGDRMDTDVVAGIEAGLQGFTVYSWQAIGGPAGMAPDLANRIHAAILAALRHPDTRRRMDEIGFEVVGSTPAEFAAFQKGEIDRWKEVVRRGNITPD